jgi:hypothetical protein
MAKRIPLRQCIGCGQMKAKNELLRVLRMQDEGIIIDSTGRKNGRGAYICRDTECMKKARKSKALDRAFKMQVAEDVYESLTNDIQKGQGC